MKKIITVIAFLSIVCTTAQGVVKNTIGKYPVKIDNGLSQNVMVEITPRESDCDILKLPVESKRSALIEVSGKCCVAKISVYDENKKLLETMIEDIDCKSSRRYSHFRIIPSKTGTFWKILHTPGRTRRR